MPSHASGRARQGWADGDHNLGGMGKKTPHHIKRAVVVESLTLGLTQDQICQRFTASTGIPLSPRTLRSWISEEAVSSSAPSVAHLLESLSRCQSALSALQESVLLLLRASSEAQEAETGRVTGVPALASNGGPSHASTIKVRQEAASTKPSDEHRDLHSGAEVPPPPAPSKEPAARPAFQWNL